MSIITGLDHWTGQDYWTDLWTAQDYWTDLWTQNSTQNDGVLVEDAFI